MMFGYVEGFEKELGYISLREPGSFRNELGLGVEFDTWFQPCELSKIRGGGQ